MTTDRMIEVARNTDVRGIVMALGINGEHNRDHIKVICAFHEERKGSCAVYEDHVTCYGCGYTADGIKFIQDLYQVPFGKAVAIINKLQ